MRFLMLFLTMLAGVYQSYAQQVRIIEDEYGVKGEIRHSGLYVDSILPQQGSLDIRWRELDSLGLKTYRVKGQTGNHLPVGKWIWEEGSWNYTIHVGESIRPVFNAKGQRMRWEGSFAEGRPEGKWAFILDSVAGNGGSPRALIRIDIGYKNGKPYGALSLENTIHKNILRLKGQCDDQGVATGTWSYYYQNHEGALVKEERIYKKGLLTEVKTTDNGVLSVRKFEQNIRFIEHSGNAELFEGKRIGNERFEMDEYGSRASGLVNYDMNYYFLKGWDLEVFPFEFVRDIPVFKKLEYPLSPEEKEDIAYSRELIKSQRDSIEEQLSGNIYIHRSRSGQLDTTIAFLQLNLVRLNYIDSLLSRTEFPLFTYKNRNDQGVQHWVSGLNMLRKTQGEVYDSLEVELSPVAINADTANIFGELRNLLVKNESVLPEYYHIVESARIALKREGELKELEDRMVERFQEVQAFYADKAGIGAEINTKWVKGNLQKLLQEYARTDQYEDALRIGNEVMLHLDSLEVWQEKVAEFNRMASVLRSHYTYLAYNPYTGVNDIEITAKKRFINNVLTYMWPYTINELKDEKEWVKWSEMWGRQFRLYDYLLNFVSREDTQAKRLERRVRQEKKPERMLRLIVHQLDAA